MSDPDDRFAIYAALRRLNPIESWVIKERYGLAGTPSSPEPNAGRHIYYHRTYEELVRDCGLPRRRIQQVEQAALAKLRSLLDGIVEPPDDDA